jgi:hypothetical protein
MDKGTGDSGCEVLWVRDAAGVLGVRHLGWMGGHLEIDTGTRTSSRKQEEAIRKQWRSS